MLDDLDAGVTCLVVGLGGDRTAALAREERRLCNTRRQSAWP